MTTKLLYRLRFELRKLNSLKKKRRFSPPNAKTDIGSKQKKRQCGD